MCMRPRCCATSLPALKGCKNRRIEAVPSYRRRNTESRIQNKHAFLLSIAIMVCVKIYFSTLKCHVFLRQMIKEPPIIRRFRILSSISKELPGFCSLPRHNQITKKECPGFWLLNSEFRPHRISVGGIYNAG